MATIRCAKCGFLGSLASESCIQCGADLVPFPVATRDVYYEETGARKHTAASENENPFQPRIERFDGIGSVLGPTLSLFGDNLWLITKLVFFIFAPFEIFRAMSVGPDESRWQYTLGIGFLGLACKALVAPSLIFALVRVMQTGTPPTLSESYRFGLSKLGRFSLAVGIAWTLQTIGMFLLIIPGIILALAFELVYPIATLESLRPDEVVKRSYDLTKGYRWNILFAVIVLSLIVGAVRFSIAATPIVLGYSAITYWPLNVTLAMINDVANELTTVLSLVIYISILSHVKERRVNWTYRNS